MSTMFIHIGDDIYFCMSTCSHEKNFSTSDSQDGDVFCPEWFCGNEILAMLAI